MGKRLFLVHMSFLSCSTMSLSYPMAAVVPRRQFRNTESRHAPASDGADVRRRSPLDLQGSSPLTSPLSKLHRTQSGDDLIDPLANLILPIFTVNIPQMYVTVEDQPLYFRVYRPELPVRSNGITFVFIHGLGSSHSFYAAIIPSLVRQGFTCLAIDTPGWWKRRPIPLTTFNCSCLTRECAIATGRP